MFKIGDYVAHYKEGVCEVVNIGKIDMGSSDKEYYTLKPVYDAAGTVYTPVDNKREQIRQLITKEEAKKVLNKQLEIQSENLAMIPTKWKTEILCWEFKGKVEDNEFLVYINAQTGKEEDILVIVNTPDGTLTH